MEKSQFLSPRQLRLWCCCALLSPLVRQTPLTMVREAGRCAWISALLSALPLLGMLALLRALLNSRVGEEGLGELFLRALGRRPGQLLLGAATLWLLFYGGFVLRAGADRFIATVYPHSGSAGFILVMGALGLMAALGRKKILGRFAEVAAPVLFTLLLLLFPAILRQVDWAQLLPSGALDAQELLRGALPAVNTLSLAALGGFVSGGTGTEGRREGILAALGAVGLVTLLCISTVGVFGPALTAKMYYPFFVLLRNVRPLRFLERLEPLLIAQWVVTDFLLFSLLLHAAERNLQLCLGRYAPGRRERVLCVFALSLLSAFLCARDSFSLLHLSETWIPLGNGVLLFLVLPMIWCVGRLRHTI